MKKLLFCLLLISAQVNAQAPSGSISGYVFGGSTTIPNVILPVAITATVPTVVGYTINCTHGTWTNSPSGYTYQWQRNGVDIGGATSTTYVTTITDLGQILLCKVTATNNVGFNLALTNSISPGPVPGALVTRGTGVILVTRVTKIVLKTR